MSQIDTNRQYTSSQERVDIRVLRVYEEPILRNGVSQGMELFVEYSPTGTDDMTRITRKASDLLNVETAEDDDPDSVMHNIARARAVEIQNALRFFKSAQDTPHGHMALENWSGLTPTMVRALRSAGVRSLQELAGATEPVKARMASTMPNPGRLIEQCRIYLSSLDRSQTAAALAEANEQNALLREKMAMMERNFAAIAAKLGIVAEELVPEVHELGADDPSEQEPEELDPEDEDAIRSKAKVAGIRSWHIKSIATLKQELAELHQEAAA